MKRDQAYRDRHDSDMKNIRRHCTRFVNTVSYILSEWDPPCMAIIATRLY